jgi:LacI family transcriptional regulator
MRMIARETGLSVATVSRALKNESNVTSVTRGKVLQAAKRLEIKELVHAPSADVKLVYLMADVIDNPYYFSVLPDLDRVFSTFGYRLMTSFFRLPSGGAQREKALLANLHMVLQAQPAGILSIRNPLAESAQAMLNKSGVPLIQLFRVFNDSYDSVVYNDEGNAKQAIKFLLGNGHRRILALGNEFILAGCRAAYREAEVPHENFRGLLLNAVTPPLITGAIREFAPTAILSHTEVCTLTTLRALAELGKRIPEDVSLVAYDDFPWMKLQGISIVQQSLPELAQSCCNLLVTRLSSGETTGSPIHIKLDGEFIVRSSVAPPWEGLN